MHLPQRIVMLSLISAGLIHALIAPDHGTHAPAHGLFFGLVGLAQLGYAALWWRRDGAGLRLPGLLLSGGVIVIWGLSHWVATPFATTTHALDWAASATKLAEATAFVALLWLDRHGFFGRTRANPARVLIQSSASSLVAGGLIWGLALALTPSLPQLAEAPNHTHDVSSP